jgi:DNA replication protein DnaC
MLAIGLARAAAEAGHRVYFTTADDLAKRCHKAALEGRWATLHAVLVRPTAAGHRRIRLRPKESRS